MATVVEKRPVTTGVLTQLAALSFSVGDGQKPASPSPDYPYAVVYPLPDAERSGPMSDGQADVTHNIQVTSVGETQEQAETLADLVRARMQDGTLTITGREVSLVELADAGTVDRDNEEEPPLFYVPDVYSILTTPA